MCYLQLLFHFLSKEIDVYTSKLIGLGSDGAANMTGIRIEILYQSCSNYAPGVKIDPAPGVTILHWII